MENSAKAIRKRATIASLLLLEVAELAILGELRKLKQLERQIREDLDETEPVSEEKQD
jgi:hypothetical protein